MADSPGWILECSQAELHPGIISISHSFIGDSSYFQLLTSLPPILFFICLAPTSGSNLAGIYLYRLLTLWDTCPKKVIKIIFLTKTIVCGPLSLQVENIRKSITIIHKTQALQINIYKDRLIKENLSYIFPTINLFVHLSIFSSIYLSIYPCIYLSIYLSIYLGWRHKRVGGAAPDQWQPGKVFHLVKILQSSCCVTWCLSVCHVEIYEHENNFKLNR